MRAIRFLATALLALWAGSFVLAGQDGILKLRPSAATLSIWTSKLGYLRGHDWLSVYLAMDRAGDVQRYRQFIYLENIETKRRQYLVGLGGLAPLRDEIVDVTGLSPQLRDGVRVRDLPPTRILGARALEPGLWQFVTELRSPDTTEVVKSAHARFVVSRLLPKVIGGDGRDTEIRSDTTWSNDRIHAVRHQVFVNAGATLTIEPGTLILGSGQQAVIVVERGGRIEARGRPDAPVVMTCDAPVGQRYEGCWGGVVLLGSAPMARGTDLAMGIVPAKRPLYGGADRLDSSGVLQYVRVEFAGSGTGAGLALRGVGSGTLIDHVQVHASAADGILFSGGTASCTYCVASGARANGLAWTLGWQGSAQHVFVQMSPEGRGHALAGENDPLAFDALPRSAPTLYNLTLVGGLSRSPERGAQGGILLRSGTAVTARNVLVTGFPAGAIEARDDSLSLFSDGTSSIANAILHANGGQSPDPQIFEGLGGTVGYRDASPRLANVAYRANPDPRPLPGSPALRVGASAVPRSDGLLDTSAQYVGAFGDSNWLAGWTFFGPESDFDTREQGDEEEQQ